MSVLKKICTCVTTVAFVLAIVGCGTTGASSRKSSTKEPEWVKNPASAYAKDAYLFALGEASTLQNAQDIAMENMARLFSTTVQSDRIVYDRYSHAVQNGIVSDTNDTTMTSNVRTSANVSALIGVALDKTWTSPEGRFYVLAALDRKKASDEYVRMIADNNNSINALTAKAKSKPGTIEAYSCCSLSAVLATMNNEYITILAIVDPATSKKQAALCTQPDVYTMQAAEAARKITFALSVNGDRENRLTQAFASVLTGFGFAIAGQSNSGPLKYTLLVNCAISPSDMAGDKDVKYARYEIRASMNDVSTGKTVYPFSANGRSGHVSQAEANQKALRTAEKKILSDFAVGLTAWIDGLAGISR